jgi:hypothetical protein
MRSWRSRNSSIGRPRGVRSKAMVLSRIVIFLFAVLWLYKEPLLPSVRAQGLVARVFEGSFCDTFGTSFDMAESSNLGPTVER